MVDKGFDVRDYQRVRSDLGTLTNLKAFKKKAHENGLHVFMDLVFNHVSDQHDWFKKAQKGEEYYKNLFIHTKEKPHFIRKFHKDAAVWAEYEINGEKKLANIAFPEQAGEIPHWRQGEDGVWYYHTYYPQQLDVNWLNPNVFIEYGKFLMYWASLGFHFRLDAIPFVGQSAYKETDNNHQHTYLITAALHALARFINPECAFIVETYEALPTVIDYFGKSNMHQAELSYNFHLCTKIWISIVKKDSQYLLKTLHDGQSIPTHAEWINFLRNHDELSLAYTDEHLKENVSEEILKYGAPFREGYGISGRTFSLLGNNERRFLMAYFILFSLNNAVAIPYGDELGKRNIPDPKLSAQDRKDTRNINRGKLTLSEINSKKGQRIYSKFKELLQARKLLLDYMNVCPVGLPQGEKDKEIIAIKYAVGISELVIFINLSDNLKDIPFNTEEYKKIVSVNGVTLRKNEIVLGSYSGVWLQK
jgi:maltose alpha-D-glucosyltransferase/alpha-amylase